VIQKLGGHLVLEQLVLADGFVGGKGTTESDLLHNNNNDNNDNNNKNNIIFLPDVSMIPQKPSAGHQLIRDQSSTGSAEQT